MVGFAGSNDDLDEDDALIDGNADDTLLTLYCVSPYLLFLYVVWLMYACSSVRGDDGVMPVAAGGASV